MGLRAYNKLWRELNDKRCVHTIAYCAGIHIGDITERGKIVAYVELRLADGSTLFGVGIDKNIVVASLKAVVSRRQPGAEAITR